MLNGPDGSDLPPAPVPPPAGPPGRDDPDLRKAQEDFPVGKRVVATIGGRDIHTVVRVIAWRAEAGEILVFLAGQQYPTLVQHVRLAAPTKLS